MPVPGYDVRVVDADGTELKPGETGEIVVKLPLPLGCLPTLWRDDQRFVELLPVAAPGFYTTADGGYRDADGYLYVMGRIDDAINVAGHWLSTGQMEEVLASHPAVAECAVIGVNDAFKGQIPRGFVVLKAEVSTEPGHRIRRARRADPGPDRAGRRAAPGRRGRRPTQDPLRQDTAQDHARHRRRPGRAGALDHRGPSGPRHAAPRTSQAKHDSPALQPRSRYLAGDNFGSGKKSLTEPKAAGKKDALGRLRGTVTAPPPPVRGRSRISRYGQDLVP